jgi:hypothetical protein
MKKLLFLLILATTVFAVSTKLSSKNNASNVMTNTTNAKYYNLQSPKILLMVTRQDKSPALWWSYEPKDMKGC